MKRIIITGLVLSIVGTSFAGEEGEYKAKIPAVIQEAQEGYFEKISPEEGTMKIAPLGTEIPLDSLRKLKMMPLEPKPSPENQDKSDGGPPHILAPPVLTEFQATGYTGWIPPDPVIAVGYDDIVVVVNSTIQIYSKTGTLLYSSSLYSFFSVVSPSGSPFDPKIIFDQYEKRYVLLALARNTNTHESSYLIAVSTDSTASGTWWVWNLDATQDGSNPTNNWADYPGLGYDQQAVYITSNQYQFGGGFQYAKVRILDKSDLYSGWALGWYDFWNWSNNDGSLVFTWKPAHSYGTVSSEYLINTKSGGWNKVTLWRIDNPLSSPSLTRQATITVQSYQPPPPAEQPGDTAHINTLDSRIPDPVIYRGGYLYTSFTEKHNWGSGNRAAIRWLKINTSTNSTAIDNYWGLSSGYYYYPALTVDRSGNMVIVFARSSSSEYAGIRYTGWKNGSTAPLGSTWLKQGEGPYELRDQYGRNRWGDYFGAAVDPTDDYTIWIFGEYATNTNTWSTWVGKVAFLPDLTDTTPTGWDYPIVPRTTNDATGSYAPLPTYLYGNDTTYLNFAWTNQGDNPVLNWYSIRTYIDNELKYTAWEPYTGVGTIEYRTNRGPYIVRGGRHTVFDSVDADNDITEYSEANNMYSQQFVWSPLVLSSDNGVLRDPPPDKLSPGGAYYNCDGYVYAVPSTFKWGGVAILPTSSSDDYDLLLYDDYVNSSNGFDTYSEYSGYLSGYSDFILVNRGAGAPIYNYFGAIGFFGGNNGFYVNGDVSGTLSPTLSLSGEADTFGTYQVDTNDVFDVWAVHITQPGLYYFKTHIYQNVFIGISLYHKDSVHVTKSEAMAMSTTTGPGYDAYFEVTISDTGVYGFAIWKGDYSGAGSLVQYDIIIGLGPTNLTYYTPSGWDYPVVPRDTNDATVGYAPLTDSLPGNSAGTYINFSFINNGMNNAPPFSGRILLDGENLTNWYMYYGLPSSSYTYASNWGPYFIRGGRHTLGDSLDINDDVWETDETDNYYERQFIWTPLTITRNTPVTRTVPPDYGNGVYPNSDGFRFTRTPFYAQAIGILPKNSADDYDLRVYLDYSGADSGFSVIGAVSYYGSGAVDFVVSTYNVGETTVYPAVTRYSGTTNDSFAIEPDDSYGNLIGSFPYVFPNESIGPREILNVYEVYLIADSSYRFYLQNLTPGNVDVGLYLYPNTSGYYGRSYYVAYSATGQMAYTAPTTAWYPLVVAKIYSNDLSADVTYDLGIEELSLGTWIGAISSDWHDPSNWVGNTVPDTSLDAIIPGWAPNMPVITDSNAFCGNLTIQSGASLTVDTVNFTVYGDVVIDGGSLDLVDDWYCKLYVYGNWDDSGGIFQETSSTDWQTPWVIFLGSGTHNITQGTGNSFSGIEFWTGDAVLQTPVSAYWYFNLNGGNLNTNGNKVWINRALRIVSSLSTLTQSSDTIEASGVSFQSSGTLNLTGGVLISSLDDPYHSEWDDRFITFQPSDDYTAVFTGASDVQVYQGSGNYFGRLIVDKGITTLSKNEPSEPLSKLATLEASQTPKRYEGLDPTTVKGKSRVDKNFKPQSPGLLSNTINLATDVTVRKSLEITNGSVVNLGGNTLRILGVGMTTDTTLLINGTVSLSVSGDSLLNQGDSTAIYIGSSGTLNISNGYMFAADELLVDGTLNVSGGTIETNTTGKQGKFVTNTGSQFTMTGGTMFINRRINGQNGSNWNVTGGTIHLFGNNTATITASDPSVGFYNLTLGNGTTNKAINFSHVTGHLTVSNVMEVLGNTTVDFYGDTLQVGDTLLLNGQFLVSGATVPSVLQMGNNARILVMNGGRLSTIGIPTNSITVTHLGTGRYYYEVYSGGWISAKYTMFEYMKSPGIRFRSGSNLDPVSAFINCTFRNGASGGSSRLITFNNSQTVTIDNAVFPENTWGSTYNVYKGNNSGHITFMNATGLFAGEDYDYDPNNRVDWTVSFVEGDANNDGVVDDKDLVYLSNYLFHGGPAPTPFLAGDNDHDCDVTQADIDYLANYLYYGGPAPSPCGTLVNTGTNGSQKPTGLRNNSRDTE